MNAAERHKKRLPHQCRAVRSPGVVGRGKPRVNPGDEVAVTDIPEKEEQRVCGLVQATIAKVVPGNRARAEMSGFRTGVGGLGEPAFGELPVARQPRGISRLPEVDGDKADRCKFKSYPIGYFHIDIAEVRTEQGKLHLFVAIDRTSKFAFVELHEKATTRVSADFLRRLLEAVPYKVHTVLTDNGIQFTTPGAGGSAVPEIQEALAKGELFRAHAFELACAKAGIDHRTTKPKHPWTNGQVERMNRTIKEATVKRFHYDDNDQLRRHLAEFVAAYNFGRRLKTLKGLTPYEFICKRWTTEPEHFTLNPLQQMPGLNN